MVVFSFFQGSVVPQEIEKVVVPNPVLQRVEGQVAVGVGGGAPSVLYCGVEGVPVLSYTFFPTTGTNRVKRDIHVWENGKIIWRDYSRSEFPPFYFEAKISDRDVSELLDKIYESRRKNLLSKPSERGTNHVTPSIILLHDMIFDDFVVSAPTYYERIVWSPACFEAVVSKKDIFMETDQDKVRQHLASIYQPLPWEGDHSKTFLRLILYRYHAVDGNARNLIATQKDIESTDEFSTDETNKYLDRFIADARHFLYCRELIESLIEKVDSQNEKRTAVPMPGTTRRIISVIKKNDGGSVQYEYVPR